MFLPASMMRQHLRNMCADESPLLLRRPLPQYVRGVSGAPV